MKRIIFVGMHNKPGMKPLDSKTRSGKLIDRIIALLPDFECHKTNLFDFDHWPSNQDATNVIKWAERIGYCSDDIIVTLGECVHAVFKKSLIEFIRIGHPSAQWSKEKQSEYIELALKRIQKSTPGEVKEV